MKVKSMKEGEGLLDGLKKIGKDLKQPAKMVGKEVLKEIVPIAKESAKEAIKSKMSGSKPEKEGGFLVTAGTIGATLLADQLIKNQGKGIYSAGIRMSPQQTRNIRMGKGITLNKKMMGDAERYVMSMGEEQAKKVMKALSKNKGVKITMDMIKDLVDKKTGKGIFGKVASVVAPIIAEKVIDAGAKALEKKIDGAGFRTAGAGFMTAGAGIGIPIQTGSPYAMRNSAQMTPFIDSGLLNGTSAHSRNSKRGSGMCVM
jgi:hypothetical protein